MAEIYEFTRTGVCPSDLTQDINNDGRIVSTCLAVTIDDIDQVSIIMNGVLDASQQLILESIVMAHVCVHDGSVDEPGDVDPVTGVNVSFAEMTLMFAESSLNNNDWVQIGSASDADSGYVMPADGVITRMTAQVEEIEKGNQLFWIDVYIDDTPHIKILEFGPNSTRTNDLDTSHDINGYDDVYNQRRIKNGLNLQFNAGQKIRLRAGSTGGNKMNDTVLVIWFKWRN